VMNYSRFALGFTILNLASLVSANECNVKSYEFAWRGQFAGFMVKGRFSFDANLEYQGGIVREDDLLDLTIRFYNPTGTMLKEYYKNQMDENTNFAFSTFSEELLQDGTYNVDDNELFYRNGFTMGEGDPGLRKVNGVQSGMSFWSRPGNDKTPHLHVDDWNDESGAGEFNFPIAYSTHEDASFAYATTQAKIDGGKVSESYYSLVNGVNKLSSDIDAFGQTVRVMSVTPTDEERMYCNEKVKSPKATKAPKSPKGGDKSSKTTKSHK